MEHYYYLGLDVFSIAFPLAASFEGRVQYWRKWRGLFTGIGVMALVFLACHALALVLRDLFGRILYSAWALFAVTCVAAVAMAWLLASLYGWTVVDPLPFAVQALTTIGLYPFFGFAFAFVERRVVVPMRA